MSIYRGPGGPGDAVNDSSSEASIVVIAKDAALAAQLAAELAATEAAASATDAADSATAAAASAGSVGADADAAAASAAAAAASAAAAALDATDADNAASIAIAQASTATSAATTATTAASTATTQASNASTSASSASTSATNASNSASSAATSATNAATSATSASGSATSASASASSASTSATNAASSATSASGSATTATTQAGIATTQATNAASSASSASTSASSASTSATNAASSASSAATSASSASSAADAALAALDNFDDRYLGQKATAPALDNDGNALVTGALYFDTTTNSMKVWDGSAWLSAYSSLSGALLSTNNLSDLASVSTARTNLGLGTAATTNSTAYATAAQGTTADAAVSTIESADGSVSLSRVGNVVDLSVGIAGSTSNLIAPVRNQTGSTLTKGTVVYISGASGNKALVSKSQASSESASSGTFGMVNADINNNANGYVTISGIVSGLNTSAYADGTVLYLSPTVAGGYTSTKPSAPNHLVYIGTVTYSHATQGAIQTRIQNGYELEELHNVALTSPTNGQVLTFDSATNLWKNSTFSGGDPAGTAVAMAIALG